MSHPLKKRVVITGIGAVTPIGLGAEPFSDALLSGVCGIRNISRFDVSRFKSRQSADVPDCDWRQLLGRKECWSGSRSVSFALAAAKLAIEHAGIDLSGDNKERIGVSIGTTLACLDLMARFDRQSLTEGPRTCDPLMFPDTGVSAPACRISMFFGVCAFNVTLSNGETSSLDAIQYAAEFIRKGLAHTVLAGGLEEISPESFAGAYVQGLLSGSRDGVEQTSRPFDRRRNGIVPGEGCVILALEDYDHARARGARIWAEVLGYGMAFGAASSNGVIASDPPCRAMRMALEDACVNPAGVDLISCGANSTVLGDLAESKALRCVFGDNSNAHITAIKSMLGESYSASGAMQAAACAIAMRHGIIPPTINCDQPDPRCATERLVRAPISAQVRVALTNSIGCTGSAASLVLAAPN